jgi:hypothetical protein
VSQVQNEWFGHAMRDIQLTSLLTLADAYQEAMPELHCEVDAEKLILRVECFRSAELAIRIGGSDSWIPALLDSLAVDLGDLTTQVNNIFRGIAPHFPKINGYSSLAQKVRFCPVAMPIVNAVAGPHGIVLINHSVIRHLFVDVAASFLLLCENEIIADSHSLVGQSLRRAIGTEAQLARGSLPLASKPEQNLAFAKLMAAAVKKFPGLLSEIEYATERLTEFIIAHEASHVVLGHTEQYQKSRRFLCEMQADELAIEVLVNLVGKNESMVRRLWLKLPPAIALLEMGKGELGSVESVETFTRMIRRRPSWDHRLNYLIDYFPSDVSQEVRTGLFESIRTAIEAVWNEIEGSDER